MRPGPTLPLLALVASLASAHPAHETRTAAIGRRMAAEPRNADLLLQRAAIHADHADWAAARADLEAARAIDPRTEGLDLAAGLVALRAGDPRGALAWLDAAVTTRPGDATILAARARCLALLDRAADAAEDLARAIEAVPANARPQPDLYVQRARLLLSLGPAHRAAALATLDAGRARLGPAAVLDAVQREMDACAPGIVP